MSIDPDVLPEEVTLGLDEPGQACLRPLGLEVPAIEHLELRLRVTRRHARKCLSMSDFARATASSALNDGVGLILPLTTRVLAWTATTPAPLRWIDISPAVTGMLA
jgi:hypothetical protein